MQDHTLSLPALKVCCQCGESKPLSEFYQRKSGKRAGAYDTRCKACFVARYQNQKATDPMFRAKRNEVTRIWRENNRDHIAEYNARVYAEQPETKRAAVKASAEKHPDHHHARRAVKNAVRHDEFPPAATMVCEYCQEAQAADWHHHKGYAEEHWLDVIALCTACHGKAHWTN